MLEYSIEFQYFLTGFCQEEMEFPTLKLGRSCALSLSSDPAYVLHFACQGSATHESREKLIGAAISNTHEIKLYLQDTFCCHAVLSGHNNSISGIVFDKLDPALLWSSSMDGTLRLWDCSNKKQEKVVFEDEDNLGITAMGLSCDGKLLAIALEKNPDSLDVLLHVFDVSDKSMIRKVAQFEDIHSDDVTQIKFHPTEAEIVATCSMDGLVTILTLSTFDEQEALLQTLNIESSVSTVGFFGPEYEYLYSLTTDETIQMWKYLEGDLISITKDFRKKTPDDINVDYAIDCVYHSESRRLFLLAGNHSGALHLLHLNLDAIEPFQSFCGGHSATIRCVHVDEGTTMLLTGAEDGMVCAWMALQAKENVDKSHKIKDRKSRDKTPYKKKKK